MLVTTWIGFGTAVFLSGFLLTVVVKKREPFQQKLIAMIGQYEKVLWGSHSKRMRTGWLQRVLITGDVFGSRLNVPSRSLGMMVTLHKTGEGFARIARVHQLRLE